MKKLLLIITVISSVFAANAQRNIDWSVDEVIGLDTIYSGAQSTPLPIHFVTKNLGPDTAFAGDSVLFQYVLSAGNQIIAAYPNSTSYLVIILTDTLLPNDTMHITRNVVVQLKVNASVTVQSTVISLIVNRPGLPFETTTTNNAKAKATTWMNEQRWPVGLAEELAAAANSVQVYPVPANDQLTINIDYNKASSVNVMDITGKLIETAPVTMGEARIDVNNYKGGVYFYQIKDVNGSSVKSGKFTVSH
jgi:hypothetical protein